jgi:hypothetical protein
MIQLHLLSRDMVDSDVDKTGLKKLAEICRVPEIDFSDKNRMQRTADRLKNKYSSMAT